MRKIISWLVGLSLLHLLLVVVPGTPISTSKLLLTISDLQTRASQTILYMTSLAQKVKRKGLLALAKLGIACIAVGAIVSLVYVIGGHSN